MKKIGSKFSNRTKVIGGVTILLGIGTVISAVNDHKKIEDIENELLLEEAAAAEANIVDAINNVEVVEF